MDNPSFLPVYDAEFSEKLDLRSETFRLAFATLEAMARTRYTIVETGCARDEGNWAGDGQSTILFDRFVNHHDGRVLSVDIDAAACERLRPRVSAKVTVTCSDSVAYLRSLAARGDLGIDLLYLDAYDFDVKNPHPSSLHHLFELCAAMPLLASGALVVVDDSALGVAIVQHKGASRVIANLGVQGKGQYVAEWFARIGCRPLMEGYQHGWIMP